MGRAFEARKATMMKRWDRMAKAFTRVGREISIAVKGGGPIPDNNPALRRAIQNARALNMPKDKIAAAIDKADGGNDGDFATVIYEGYGPHGVAILVETATDNTTRTVANVRLCFKKGNGSLGNSGSVAFQFEKMASFQLKPEDVGDREEFELEMIDHGLEQLDDGLSENGDPVVVVRTAFTEFGSMQDALDSRGIEPVSSGTEYVPNDVMELGDEAADEVLALIDRLEQDDDVQSVFHTLA